MHKMLCIFHAQACIWTKKYNHLHISWLQMVVFKLVLRGLTQSVCPVTIFNNMHLQFFYQIINLKSNCLHRVNAFTLNCFNLHSTYCSYQRHDLATSWLFTKRFISVDETELEFSKHKRCQQRVASKYPTILTATNRNIASYYWHR